MGEEHTFNLVLLVTILLFISSVVAATAKRLNFPYTIFLVIIGLAMGVLGTQLSFMEHLLMFRLTPDVVVFVFLPVLLFESAFNLNARALFKNLVPILTLAIPALLISTAIVGGIVHFALGLPLDVSLLFGALISATDPVAVVALFKEMGAPKRLNLLVEGESLFNDGTALVLFKILIGIVIAGHFSSMTVVTGIGRFLLVFLGGVAVGAVFGFVFSKAIEAVENDPFIEITLTTILAHSTFIAAEHFLHVSGVMATVAAGLTLGSYGRDKISPPVQEHMKSFWEYFVFVCNSLIFLLVGLSIDMSLFVRNIGAVAWAVGAVLLARGVAVYTLMPLIARLNMAEPVGRSYQTVVFWGGLRGALAIAMALSIPDTIEQKPFILVLSIGVVLFTLIVNGLTVRPLMRLLALDRYSLSERLERVQAMFAAKKKAVNTMDTFLEEGAIGPRAVAELKGAYKDKINEVQRELDALKDRKEGLSAEQEKQVAMRHCLLYEKARFHRIFEQGFLRESNLRDLNHDLDVQLDRLEVTGVSGAKSIALKDLFRGVETTALKLAGAAPPLKPLIRHYKTVRIADSYERSRARLAAIGDTLEFLEELRGQGTFSVVSLSEVRQYYENLHSATVERMDDIKANYPEYVEKVEAGIVQRFCLNHELSSYRGLFRDGSITDKILKEFESTVRDENRRMRMRPVEELLIPAPKLLKMVPLFKEIPPEDLRRLNAQTRALSFLSGEDIVRAGDQGSSLYVIGRGRVDVFTPDGEQIASLEAGNFFGEIALLNPQPRTATVRAATACTLLELRREVLLPILDDTPRLKEILETAYRVRLSELEEAEKSRSFQ